VLLVGSLVVRSVDRSVGRSVGRLVGMSVGPFIRSFVGDIGDLSKIVFGPEEPRLVWSSEGMMSNLQIYMALQPRRPTSTSSPQ
jgi:hypothetical protein